MFDDKENLVGLALLGLCAVAGGVLVWAIVTDRELTYTGPRWLIWVLGVLFFGGILYGTVQAFSDRRRSGGAEQWPNPYSGRRPWWKFWGDK